MKMTDLKRTLPVALQKFLELASEKGASAWLMTLPIEEHGFSLPKQAFRDTLCANVKVEPPPEPLTGETSPHRTTNVEDSTRPNVKAQDFRGSDRQCVYFDVKVFNPQASTNRTQTITVSYRRHEKEKRRAYVKRVVEVENGSFTPIVFSTGGSGPPAMIM